MFSPDDLNDLIKEVMTRFAGQNLDTSNIGNSVKRHEPRQAQANTRGTAAGGTSTGADGTAGGTTGFSITPTQALVIAGILGGTLEVASVLVDTRQVVQILLTGSLKRKTTLDKMMEQMGNMKFDDVMQALLNRFG